MESISQSLAGRTAILNLSTFSIEELKSSSLLIENVDECMFTGFFPRIYDQKPLPQDFYQSYIKTYIERDVRELKNISDLSVFHKFIRLCAGRTGQILNVSELATEAGISVLTVKSWISVLETSGIIFQIKPYFNNLGKRLIKSPKLYSYDTGLVCSLLGLQNYQQLETYYLRGGIFENLIISNYLKECYFKGQEPNAYFWRDSNGVEVDLVIEENQKIKLYEIKSSNTMNEKFFSSMTKVANLANVSVEDTNVIYAGDKTFPANSFHGGYISWKDW
jgi:predicted AAA+ superfamily ATPase